MELKPQNKEKGIEPNIFFGNNGHFAFIYKKTEKLVTAVYMITNFIKDNEPLKWKIRESSLALLSVNIDFNNVALSERRELLKEYQALALEVVSLSSIACHSGLISEMNFNILSREFNSLVSIVDKDENKQASEQTVILDPRFFETEAHESAPQTEIISYKGQTPQISRTITPAPENKQKTKSPTVATVKDTQNSRQSIIINLLSKKSGLNIKDFTENITGCSEKTIQRELLAMVAGGVLKKIGERRWSTYSLASQAQ